MCFAFHPHRARPKIRFGRKGGGGWGGPPKKMTLYLRQNPRTLYSRGRTDVHEWLEHEYPTETETTKIVTLSRNTVTGLTAAVNVGIALIERLFLEEEERIREKEKAALRF